MSNDKEPYRHYIEILFTAGYQRIYNLFNYFKEIRNDKVGIRLGKRDTNI